MISSILRVFESGLDAMRQNTRMLLVGALVFIFPLLFIWVTNSFFEFTRSSIDTAEKHRIGILHDALTSLVLSNAHTEVIQNTIKTVVERGVEGGDSDKIRVTDIRLYKEVGGEIELINAIDTTLIGTTSDSGAVAIRKAPLSDAIKFFTSQNLKIGEKIVRHSYQRIVTPEGIYFIITEQDRTLFESVLLSREQTTYLALSVIFTFIIILAYWLNRQDNWEKKHKKLAIQLEERDLFFNTVAHEFRSPLTAIKGYASFLQESKNISKDEVRFAANINNSAERLVVLVGDFLEIARLQSGRMKIVKEELDMREVLTEIVNDLVVLAEEKNLKLIYTKTEKPIILSTDKARLIQVLTNIVTNSIKYTERGQVELECTRIPGEVTIFVKDTGTGISAEDQQKLFAPFTRVGGVDNTTIKGTGLGMWITKQLVALLGGTIGVESIKGIGTHIVITFRT